MCIPGKYPILKCWGISQDLLKVCLHVKRECVSFLTVFSLYLSLRVLRAFRSKESSGKSGLVLRAQPFWVYLHNDNEQFLQYRVNCKEEKSLVKRIYQNFLQARKEPCKENLPEFLAGSWSCSMLLNTI